MKWRSIYGNRTKGDVFILTIRKAGEILYKMQSSSQTRCIKIIIKNNDIALTTQLDEESTISVLEKCLDSLKDKTSRKEEVPIGKES